MKKVVLVSLLYSLVLIACTSKEMKDYKQDGQAVLEQLDKLRAAVEIGMNYTDFSSKLGEANYYFTNFTEKYQHNKKINKLNSYRAIASAIVNYKAAMGFWDAKIKTPFSQDLEYDLNLMKVDELIKLQFFSAAFYSKNAKALINNDAKDNDQGIANKCKELNETVKSITDDIIEIKTAKGNVSDQANEIQNRINTFEEEFGTDL